MKFKIVIPARFASTRLKGKVLKRLNAKPILQWVWEAANKSQAEQVYIATDAEEILDIAKSFGAQVIMTRSDHETGTDRLGETASILELQDDEILVNVQGDEPLINPSLINQVAQNLVQNPEFAIATLYSKIDSWADFINPNVVKIINDKAKSALAFSRSPLPFPRDLIGVDFSKLQNPPAEFINLAQSDKADFYKRHLGIYAYRAKFLHAFANLAKGELEASEQLEQLRALENGYKIHVDLACAKYYGGIDTQADLDNMQLILESN